jgi:hypothetical protein
MTKGIVRAVGAGRAGIGRNRKPCLVGGSPADGSLRRQRLGIGGPRTAAAIRPTRKRRQRRPTRSQCLAKQPRRIDGGRRLRLGEGTSEQRVRGGQVRTLAFWESRSGVPDRVLDVGVGRRRVLPRERARGQRSAFATAYTEPVAGASRLERGDLLQRDCRSVRFAGCQSSFATRPRR